jgi:hypothetical protein
MKIRTHPIDQTDTSANAIRSEEFPGGHVKLIEIFVPLKSEICHCGKNRYF